MTEELTPKKRAALNGLKTVRGHLDGIIRMLETDAYCVDVMKQISAVQSALERTNRVMLHNHLETCFSEAVVDGRGATAIEELVDASSSVGFDRPGCLLERHRRRGGVKAGTHELRRNCSIRG